jgi:hypothetical protein
VRRLLIGVAAQEPGKPYRLALIGYRPGAKVVQVRSEEDVAKLVARHHAAGVVWEGADETFRTWDTEPVAEEAASVNP